MVKEVAIVFPVAGLSSRFGGVKQFAKIGPNNETLIEYSLNQALKAGFSKIIFIVGEKTEHLFREKFGDNYQNTPVQYVLQYFNPEKRDRPWGTADALCCIKNIINCPFVFCNGDDIYGENTFRKLFNHLQESNECASIGYNLKDALPDEGAVHRGIFNICEHGYVQNLIETFNIELNNLAKDNLTPNHSCSMNIFALHPGVIDMLHEELINFKQNNQEDRKVEFLIPTEISRLIQNNQIRMKIHSTPDKWFGVTNPEDEAIVREMLRELS